jgi:SAM-dependent methyltransferase
MPTLPPRFSSSESHLARQLAESFGTDAERYDRTRPRYPDAMVAQIIASSPGRGVLDVGVGTGVSARPFQESGCEVLGVDPDERMAAFARRSGLVVEVATFEDWDPAGRSFDAVIAGQTWHWVDPVAGAAKAAAVLRPGGRLALFWNVSEPPPDLAAAFAAVYQRVLPDSLFSRGTAGGGLAAYAGLHTNAANGILAAGGFTAPAQWRFDWARRYTRAEWLDLVPTAGGHSQFPPETLDALLTGLGSAIDAVGGQFTMDYVTVVVTATRTESRPAPA